MSGAAPSSASLKTYVIKSVAPKQSEHYDLIRELNAQQRAVVLAPPGRILVLAGAGTGKTRTLTYRVARLVRDGCRPDRLMLVTFTNRAAKEMVERVTGLLGVDMRKAAAGTFHHVGNRILRKYGRHVGVGPDFNILDPEDARDLMAATIAEEGLESLSAKRFPNAKLLYAMVSLAAGMQMPIEKAVPIHFPKFAERTPAIRRVALRYEQRKRELNVCDFDDLLVKWYELCRHEQPEVRAKLLEGWDHLLVDEYQDINTLQGLIIDAMTQGHGSLTCVGDDAQSIYSFRGADFSQIYEFKSRHASAPGGASVMPLTINYRSTPEILALANRSISLNKEQHPKKLSAVRDGGDKPAVLALRDVYQQAEFVAQRVLELHHDEDLDLRQIAVLYRNHSHSLELQVELTRREIPFSVRSGVRFFEQAHIKDVVCYLRARENRRDALAWVRVLRLWPGIGSQTAHRIAEALSRDQDERDPGEVLHDLAAQAKGRQKKALERVHTLWHLLADPARVNPGRAIEAIVSQHYAEHLDRTYDNAAARKEDLEHLAGFARRYGSAQAFLTELALVQGISAEDVVSGEPVDDKLVLSTIHQAKGLEWPCVFVLTLGDGRFPTAQSMRTQAQLEEERRLFYVAATRAKDQLYLCYPTVEDGPEGPSRLTRPSRFLTEIDTSPPVFERWGVEEAPADDPGAGDLG